MVTLTEAQCKVIEWILQVIENTGMPPTLREIANHFGWKAVGSAQDVVSALRKKGALMPPLPGKSRQLVPSSEAIDLLEKSGHMVPYKWKETEHQSTIQKRNTAETQPAVRASINPKNAPAKGNSLSDDVGQMISNLLFAPLVGLVQAGNPTEAIASAGHESVPFLPVGKRTDSSRFFAVNVEGYSMMNVGFMPGDTLLVESAQSARNGDIVLAAVRDHEVTVKRFALRGSHLFRSAFEKLPKEDISLNRVPPALLVPENPDFEPIPYGFSDADRIVGLVRSLYRKEVM
jgi:repressor LexA